MINFLISAITDNLGYADDGEEFVGVVDDLKAGSFRILPNT